MAEFGSMRGVRAAIVSVFVAVAALAGTPHGFTAARADQAATTAAAGLPAKLGDAEFWKLVTDISEPGGFFRITDNYTSNENEIGQMFSLIRERKVSGGVYLGVGPEQNLTYISAVQPAMAFVIDIRRQAVMQHLMFKAVFELSKDRADFVSLLFSKPRPQALEAATPIQKIWEAYFQVATDPALAEKNRARIVEHLTKTHGFTFEPDENMQLANVISAFTQFGPSITTRGGAGGGGNTVTFADLTGWSMDSNGQANSFLSTEEHYKTVKTLHERNLIVPVSGDFAGPKAIRAIGAYLTARAAKVSAFYVSNVEQYLFMDAKQRAFFENVAALPLTDTSVFLRPYAYRRFGGGAALCGIVQFLKNFQDGRISTNNDALACAG